MGGFFGGLAAGLGGAGRAIGQYSEQMRPILEARRHDFANLVANTLPQVQDPEFKAYLFGLGGDLANNKPLGPLMENFRNKYQKYQQTEAQYHDQVNGMAPPAQKAPPPGPGSGQVNGVKPPLVAMPESPASQMAALMSGGASVQGPTQPNIPPTALPETNPIAGGSSSSAMATIMGTPASPPAPAPPVAPSALPAAAATPAAAPPEPGGLSDQYQMTPLELANMAQYQKELSNPFGVSPRTAAAVAPIFQRQAALGQARAAAQVDVEKVNAQRQQTLGLAKQLHIDIDKLPTSARLELVTKGTLPPPQLLRPGEAYVDSDGQVIAKGPPLIQFAPEASTPYLTDLSTPSTSPAQFGTAPVASGQPPAQGLPNLGQAAGPIQIAPGVTQFPATPPKLGDPETRNISAALQVARKYNLPFDPTLNPRNPLAQLPVERQMEASTLAKQMNEDPEIRAARLRADATMEQLRQINVLLAQTQLGSMPTAANYRQMAESIVDHTLAPDQLRMLRSGGMRGWDPAKVFAETKAINPKFSWEQAENQYKAMAGTERNFTSGSDADLVRQNNVSLEHLGLMDQARIALHNNNIPVLNAIANALQRQAGKDAVTTFNTIAQRVGEEVNGAYVKGGGGQLERMAGSNQFSSSLGDTQIKNNIIATTKLMAEQQKGLEDQYQRGTYGQGTLELWSPGALATREQLLGPTRPIAGGQQPPPPSGGTVTFTVPGETKPYYIPSGQVDEFLKDHKTAKRQ